MRPAIEVWRDAAYDYGGQSIPGEGEYRAAAVIKADRLAVVAEIVAMIHESFDAPHIIDAGRKIAAMIEAKFGGGKHE